MGHTVFDSRLENMHVSGYIQTPRVAALLALLVAYGIYTLYQHVTHPLYKIPGPRLAAWSNMPYSRSFLGGHQPYDILALHEKYGPVVRVAPNEVSFSSPSSWEDIYGFRPGHKTFKKSPFYDGGSFADRAHSIVSETDPTEHGTMRKYLSHAFSDQSLTKQEHLVSEHVDLFISQLGAIGSGPAGLNIVKWFNLTTFDIIGSLAFGESFGGLKSQEFHFWIDLVTKALRKGALADTMSRFPWMAQIFMWLMPGAIRKMTEDTKIHENHTMALIERRVNNPDPRPDFLTRILEQEENISTVQLAAHASDFVTAGSETTATALSCITYNLLKTPDALTKLQQEIRTAFKRYEDINAQACNNLKYLRAVCLEAMRMYAPLPFALPRVVPEGGDTVDGIFLPAGTIVSTNPVAAGLSSQNWQDPFIFKPERWLPQQQPGSKKTDAASRDILAASQPFSLGARGCLGRNLAWMELGTILTKLHWSYDLEFLNSNELDWHRDSRMATLWVKPELMVRVRPRARAMA